MAFLKIRYKLPEEDKSNLITTPVKDGMTGASQEDIDFSTAVAAFGQLLKGSAYTGTFSYDDVVTLAQKGKGTDTFGYRAEFLNMVRLAKSLAATTPVAVPPPGMPIPVEPQPIPRPMNIE